MCLPLKSEGLDQYNKKSPQTWKNRRHFDQIVDISNTFFFKKKKIVFLGAAFTVPSQCSFPKLQLHAMKKLCFNFSNIVFLFASSQKVSDFWNSTSNWTLMILFFIVSFLSYIMHLQWNLRHTFEKSSIAGWT